MFFSKIVTFVVLKTKSSIKNLVGIVILLSLFVISNFRDAPLSKCWRGTWSEKGGEPLL